VTTQQRPRTTALDQIDARTRAWADGYAAGYAAGREVGYEAAEWEMWRGKAAWLAGAKVGLGPCKAELDRRRALDDSPCQRTCGACSRCVRAAAIVQNARRYGQLDYPGAAGRRMAS
jgi:hypothetical protein